MAKWLLQDKDYKHILVQSDLRGSQNPYIRKRLIKNNFRVTAKDLNQTEAEGLKKMHGTGGELRGITINGDDRRTSITAEELETLLPGQSGNFLRHYSQFPAQATLQPITAALNNLGLGNLNEQAEQSLRSCGIPSPKRRLSEKINILYDKNTKTVYYESIGFFQLAMIPGKEKNGNVCEVYSLFKLVKEPEEPKTWWSKFISPKEKRGFELVCFATDVDLLVPLFKGDRKELKKSFEMAPKLSWRQRLKQSWDAMFNKPSSKSDHSTEKKACMRGHSWHATLHRQLSSSSTDSLFEPSISTASSAEASYISASFRSHSEADNSLFTDNTVGRSSFSPNPGS